MTISRESTARDTVAIPVRLDFDAFVPEFSRAVASLDAAATRELDRAGVEPLLRELVRLRASQLNGCAYCVDMHSREAARAGEREQRLRSVAVWREAPFFTREERAALALAEAATRLSETHVPDEVWAEASTVLGEERTAAVVALIVAINVWNTIGVTTRCWTVEPAA